MKEQKTKKAKYAVPHKGTVECTDASDLSKGGKKSTKKINK
jgi:hypothetical protein